MKQNGRLTNAGEDKAETKLASKEDKKNTSPVPPPFRAATKVTVQQNEIPDPPPEKN